MNDRPSPRDSDGFRPWRRDDQRPPRRPGRDDDQRQGPPGETDSDGNYRTDHVWRSPDAHDAAERRPWQRRDDDRGERGGFDRERGERDSFERRPWQRRDDDRRDNRGGSDRERGGFDRERGGRDNFERRPWQRRDDDRRDNRGSSGRDRGGFDRERGGRDGFERRPWQRRDDDRRDRGSFDRRRRDDFEAERAPKKPRIPDPPAGELIYGRQPVSELLKANRRGVRMLLLSDTLKPTDETTALEAICTEREIEIQRYSREIFDSWLNAANHQGVIAVCDDYPYSTFEEIYDALIEAPDNAMVVLLDHVVDPQNLGSILRSCDAAGVLGVILPADRAVGVTSAAVRASAGAAEHLRVTIVPSLSSAIEKLKDKDSGVWVTGLEAGEESQPYTEIDLKGKVALVIGSEGKGLSSSVRGKCDFLARLPMLGKVDSLNAGVAGALAMYEVLRQHGHK